MTACTGAFEVQPLDIQHWIYVACAQRARECGVHGINVQEGIGGREGVEAGLCDGASWVGQQAKDTWVKRTDPVVSRIMRPSIAKIGRAHV